MLPSFENAHNVFGHTKKTLANGCGVSDWGFQRWATGRTRCPKHKRQSVDRAFGTPVDWVQYDLEVDAVKRLSASERPQEPRKPDLAPLPAETAQTPVPAPQSGARDISHDLWGGV